MQAVAAFVIAAAVTQQVNYAPQFWIENNTDDYVEFWIRASNRNRSWSKLKIQPGQLKYAILESADPFDFIICRLDGGKTWIYERASEVQLKGMIADGGQAKSLHLQQYVTRPVYQTSDHGWTAVMVPEYLGSRTVQINSDGRQMSMSVQYEVGHKPPYPPFPRPRPKPKKK
jgi:hypothetical protein